MSDTADETSLGAALQPSADVRRARWLLTGHFAGQGVVMATWATRLPAVKEAAGLMLNGPKEFSRARDSSVAR
ncbi:hypothetical protein [Streptomyces sp. NPDC050485]|uniref:hypothetical protein n=1 Tax=Streptomyces sp. NPDC050485 TaxID=3365617 RepID=UPI00379C1317